MKRTWRTNAIPTHACRDPVPLPRDFYLRNTLTVARSLLGCLLVRDLPDGTRLCARIVETEAYIGPEDRAAHSCGGRPTERTRVMWAAGGHLYVYRIYGVFSCLNVVSHTEGNPEAVLIRAAEPLQGLERMRDHRSFRRGRGGLRVPIVRHHPLADAALCRGPGCLCDALAVDEAFNGHDLCRNPPESAAGHFVIAAGPPPADADILAVPRVNVAYAGAAAAYPWRFLVRGNPCVSSHYPPRKEKTP